jgi:hypothetical protein
VTGGNDKIVFIHISKTGGTWVWNALKEAGVELERIPGPDWAPDHPHPRLKDFDPEGRFVFGFVREPISWYGSIWNYHRKGESQAAWWPMSDWIDEDFDTFLQRMAEHVPNFASIYFRDYVGPPHQPISFIGHYEDLVDDLVKALELSDQPFDEEKLRSVPPINTTGSTPPHSQSTAEKMIEAEAEFYNRFYSRTYTAKTTS